MTQANNDKIYANLFANGIGFLNKPRWHSNGKKLSVTIQASRGEANAEGKTDQTRFDLDVLDNSNAKKLVMRLMEKYPNLETSSKENPGPVVFVGFRCSDIRPEVIGKDKTLPTIKGRLHDLSFITVDGERIYPKPEADKANTDQVDQELVDDESTSAEDTESESSAETSPPQDDIDSDKLDDDEPF